MNVDGWREKIKSQRDDLLKEKIKFHNFFIFYFYKCSLLVNNITIFLIYKFFF